MVGSRTTVAACNYISAKWENLSDEQKDKVRDLQIKWNEVMRKYSDLSSKTGSAGMEDNDSAAGNSGDSMFHKSVKP